jgi:hypothetical protein
VTDAERVRALQALLARYKTHGANANGADAGREWGDGEVAPVAVNRGGTINRVADAGPD